LQSCPSGAGTTGPFGINDLSATDAALSIGGRRSGGNCGPPGVVDTPGTVVDVAAGAADVAVIPAASAVLTTLAPT